MKICILINSIGSGGAERQAVNLAIMLKKSGNDVSVVTFYEDDFFAAELQKHSIDHGFIRSRKPWTMIMAARKQFRRGRYDAVIAFLRTPILCACAASLIGKKWLLIVRMGSAREGFFTERMGRLMLKLVRAADNIVCNSNLEREMWLRHSSLPEDRFKVIYNLYPDISLSAAPPQKEKKSDKIRIVIPASYSGIKNISGVVDGLALMTADERSALEIHWYGHKEIATGDTSQYDQAARRIRQLGLEDTIILHDETRDIYDRMREADYVALFSHFEGLPNAICEAILLGKPVIMTQVSDYRQLVNGNGYTCAPDAESIRDTLKQVIATPGEDRRKMSAQSHRMAEEMFSYEILRQQWLLLLSAQGGKHDVQRTVS